ncbi:hypothetical protein JL721_9486 [Aureococcus anophagefferens]|nr:hypothetical protein JL721_9486 [Aureococcus anophagefferens]
MRVVVVAAVAALARVEGKQKRYRIAMFKESRTGSTWAADLLANEPAVNFFAHEAHSCCRSGVNDTFRTFYAILAAPTCAMDCGDRDARGVPVWAAAAPREPPAACAGAVSGFDISPRHALFHDAPPLSWADDWPRLLRLPGVLTVVLSARAHACYEDHKALMDRPLELSAAYLAKSTHKDAELFVDIIGAAARASGGRPFLWYYEALMLDAPAEISRLLRAVGLPEARRVAASSNSTKITADDLHVSVVNFTAVLADLEPLSPCLYAQAVDTARGSCRRGLEDGDVPWEDVEAA